MPQFWNLKLLRKLLVDYHDNVIVDYLQFGWPVSHDGRLFNTSPINNWKGAVINASEVSKYLKKELSFHSVVGPFDVNPFVAPAGVSPLNTRDKKDSDEKRIILDLSYPDGLAVNEGIAADKYLGVKIEWHLPTVDSLANIMIKKGKGCLLFKRDLRRYYRQIFVCPGDVHLLGYIFDGKLYFDCTLPMGMTSSCFIAQRVSSSLTFIMHCRNVEIVNYIDDLGGADTPDKAWESFEDLGAMLKSLGILESEAKATPPCTEMVFLGICLNSVNQTLSISQDRVREIVCLTDKWLQKSSASLKELQSLIGVLSFAASVVREGRLFFSRLLTLLKSCPKDKPITLSDDAKKDILWWNKFCAEFNGIEAIPSDIWSKPDEIFSTDACLTGVGGWCSLHYFHFVIPDSIIRSGKFVNQFELYAVLMAVRAWKHLFESKNILVYCDNSTTVSVLQSGKSSCSFMQNCLREIRFWSAKNKFRLRAVHIDGVSNRIADALSRWHLSDNFKSVFLAETADKNLTETVILDTDLRSFW